MNTKGDVKAQILRETGATRSTSAQDQIENWFQMGLQDCFRLIRPSWAIRAATVTVDEDGTCNVPPTYIAFNGIWPLAGGKPLEFLTPELAAEQFGLTGQAPTGVLIEGSLMTFIPPQSVTQSYRLSYYSELDPLDLDVDTNFWILKGGSAVLYAACRHVSISQENDPALARFEMAFSRIADDINRDAIRGRSGTGYVIRRAS
jgi:hypothetical protein